MHRYNLTYITVPPTGMQQALSGLQAWLETSPLKGKFLACWTSEIGELSRILLVHGYDVIADIPQDRETVLYSDNPFGIGQLIVSMETDAYTPLKGLPDIIAGDIGPVFEVRTYKLKPGGLTPTLDAWTKAVGPRSAYSKLLSFMYAVGGEVPRVVHIWPYKSFDERFEVRTRTVAEKVWPPVGAPPHLAGMRSEIFLPASFSPVR